MAAGYPSDGEPPTFQNAVLHDSAFGIMGASGRIATGTRQKRRNTILIEEYWENKKLSQGVLHLSKVVTIFGANNYIRSVCGL